MSMRKTSVVVKSAGGLVAAAQAAASRLPVRSRAWSVEVCEAYECLVVDGGRTGTGAVEWLVEQGAVDAKDKDRAYNYLKWWLGRREKKKTLLRAYAVLNGKGEG